MSNSPALPHISLRIKITFGLILPIILFLLIFLSHYYQSESRLLQEEIERTAVQMGELLLGSLRHAMLKNDQPMLNQMLVDMGEMEIVKGVEVVNTEGLVRASNHQSRVGISRSLQESGCTECHSLPVDSRSKVIPLASQSGMLRIGIPVKNEPACYQCHQQALAHLGMVLVDASLLDSKAYLFADLRKNTLLLTGVMALLIIVVYVLIDNQVVRRVEAIYRPLASLAGGDFTVRLQDRSSLKDELTELAYSFNLMAGQLELHQKKEEERMQIRQRAMVEERERIARELHDGLAQLLGYISMKTAAIRLFIRQKQNQTAMQQLTELEEVTQNLFVDVRQAIFGLRIASKVGNGFGVLLAEATAQFSRITGLPVKLHIDESLERLPLPDETELHLLRIIQEATSNIYKHAHASEIEVLFTRQAGTLTLSVIDNGRGFEEAGIKTGVGCDHLGLTSMCERASAIGATLEVHSQPGAGTEIRVIMPQKEA